jgi:hypothetical protein
MDITNTFTADETKCDHCGTPTPRLFPPQDIELCDACAKAEEPDTCIYCGEPNTDSWDGDYCTLQCAINAAADNQEDR